MSESLGLSLGAANLVAARLGRVPVVRGSVLTVFDGRPSIVGLPEDNPGLTGSGLVMRGFVERVGDRAPLVATDGTKYLGEALAVEALEAMARLTGTVGAGTQVTVAVPAYWTDAQYGALRDEFFAQPGLAPDGVLPALISDAAAALSELRSRPGFPTTGVVAVCDFGASGTSVTLSKAGPSFQQIGSSERNTEFSGDAIDQLVLDHVQSYASDGENASGIADSGRKGSVTRLLAACQRAKEQLSTTTTATVSGPAGPESDVALSRSEFEQLISQPLDGFLAALEKLLQRNQIPRTDLAAVALVGGGASIPLIASRVSTVLQTPILSTPHPICSAAVGAVSASQQRSAAGAATTASPIIENPTEMVGRVARPRGEDHPLAWSEDADTDEPVPYWGPEHTDGYVRAATRLDYPDDDEYPAEAGELPWYKRTALVLSLAAAAVAMLTALVLAILTLGHGEKPPPPGPTETQTVTVPAPTSGPITTLVPPPSTTAQLPPTTTEPATTPPPPPAPPPPTTTAQPPMTTQAPPAEPFPPPRDRPLRPRWWR